MSHRAVVGVIVALIAGSGQSMQAQSAAVAVKLVSVVPGAPAGVNDWCVGVDPDEVVLTAHVVTVPSEDEVTAGTVVWQVCERRSEGLPKEECQRGGSGRWVTAVFSDLAFDSTPSLATNFAAPILGFRLQYRPGRGSGLKKGATGTPFNLDRTCLP